MWGCQEEGAKLCSVIQAIGQEAMAETEAQRFHQNMRKNLFTVQVIQRWNKLSRQSVESPPLEIFKNHLGDVLCSGVIMLEQGGWAR